MRLGALFRSRLQPALLLAFFTIPASAQQVFVQPVPRHVIAERLQLASSRNSERKEILMQQFSEAGCKRLIEQQVKGSRQGNVICSLAGSSEDTILVGAHFDKANGLGVVDNWSGASLLPSLYRSLSGRKRNHTFVFVGFTDEEIGLRGSEAYTKNMDAEQRLRMKAMINIDCMGMTSTKVWARRADKRLLAPLTQVASSLNLPLEGINVGEIGDTDSLPFASKRIPVVDFHSITQKNFERLHEGRDTPDSICMDDYYDTYKLISVYLGFIDITLGKE